MRMNIEEIEKLIIEIELDKIMAKREIENRKQRRKNNEKNKSKNIKKITFNALIYLLVTNTLFTKYIDNNSNYFEDNKIVASKDDVKKAIDTIEEKLNVEVESENIDDYLVLKAILDNQNLREFEKNIALELYPLLEENNYYNKELTYHALKNIKIKWCDRPKDVDDNCYGVYKWKYGLTKGYAGKIEDYESLKKEKYSNFAVLRHELIHSIFSNENYALPKVFNEAMTELLTNEYYSENPYDEWMTYSFEILYVKMLCEILNPDIVLEAYTTGNMDIIYEAMAKNYGNKEEAAVQIAMIELYLREYRIPELFDHVFDQLDNYLPQEKKEDLNNPYYAYKWLMSSLKEEDPHFEYLKKLGSHGTPYVAYFSKNLKQKTIK